MKKILIVHNFYTQKGGEDTVVSDEISFLSKKYVVENLNFYNNINPIGFFNLTLSFCNPLSIFKLINKIIKFKPDIVYFHNLWFTASSILLIIPRLFQIRSVVKLHNYRTSCLNDLHLRNNKICTECSKGSFKSAFIYGCYKNSKFLTLLKYLHVKIFKIISKKFTDKIILLTNFHKDLLKLNIFPPEKLVVISNYSRVNVSIKSNIQEKKDFLFVGRLDESKGIDRLLNYWISSPNLKSKHLQIVGEGNLDLEKYSNHNNLTFYNQMDRDKLFTYIQNSKALIFPSIWFEGRPMVIQEAINLKTIVITSKLGGILESFEENYPYTFDPYTFDNFDTLIDTVDNLSQNNLIYNYNFHKSKVKKEMFTLFDQL